VTTAYRVADVGTKNNSATCAAEYLEGMEKKMCKLHEPIWGNHHINTIHFVFPCTCGGGPPLATKGSVFRERDEVHSLSFFKICFPIFVYILLFQDGKRGVMLK
jgi:hypothetical protein